jgi:DinB superfamily
MNLRTLSLGLGLFLVLVSTCQAQKPQSTAETTRALFNDGDRKILVMAKDFPADKYGFRLKPEMRSFGEVLVHIAGGNVWATKVGKGEKAKWDELDPKNYPDKAAIVAMLEKTFAESESVLKSWPDDAFTKSVRPWADVTEHTAEHYGLLVAYYRANGMVPPESRPQK